MGSTRKIFSLEYRKEQLKKQPKNRTTVTKRRTQTRSSFDLMMAAEPKTKRSPVRAPIKVQTSIDTDDDPDCQLLPECREAVRFEYSR
ncbi:unnamed protein product [Rotaria sp. Silwood2]|nr:unnamed protein product [Rotaria sp. Silwood2]